MTLNPNDGFTTAAESDVDERSPFLPPRWFIRTAWVAHRLYQRGTGGRRGLWAPRPGKWGTMRLMTVGRKTGKEREAIVAYFEDGPNIITMAMNGWGEGQPAWWLNLLDHPDATIEMKGENRTRAVRGRAAVGDEHDRLWDTWRGYTPHLDGYATRRTTETAVVVLEPRRD
jgi:deazaflavin-dependent oxidoreductase (nitroreductase family)